MALFGNILWPPFDKIPAQASPCDKPGPVGPGWFLLLRRCFTSRRVEWCGDAGESYYVGADQHEMFPVGVPKGAAVESWGIESKREVECGAS
jgi:hypothetical protein